MSDRRNITIQQYKVDLDTRLTEQLIQLGIITGVTDFSRKMGKNDTYYACMKNRGYGIHLGSLVFYAAKLANELNASDCVRQRARLRMALSVVNEAIQAKCKLREHELMC
jgi:hypothetical protein